jgi:hypothetical protein
LFLFNTAHSIEYEQLLFDSFHFTVSIGINSQYPLQLAQIQWANFKADISIIHWIFCVLWNCGNFIFTTCNQVLDGTCCKLKWLYIILLIPKVVLYICVHMLCSKYLFTTAYFASCYNFFSYYGSQWFSIYLFVPKSWCRPYSSSSP